VLSDRTCIVIGVVGPDGSGKSSVAVELIDQLRAQGMRVVHTHGRPQSIVRRAPPAGADPSAPHAARARGGTLSLAKYLLAAVDFRVSRSRFGRRCDVWVSERPLVDYQVDPTRYQLSPAMLRPVRSMSRHVAVPDCLVVLDGDAATMAARKPELGQAEIERQLIEWRRLLVHPCRRAITLDTTDGSTPRELAKHVVHEIRAISPRRWRQAPVKARRLDVRFSGTDVSALDIYRPIRALPRFVNFVARAAVRLHLTPHAAVPDRAIDGVVDGLFWAGERVTGVAAMASSGPGRWVVGLAVSGRLRYVAKVGPSDDPGLAAEALNLRQLEGAPIEGIAVPRLRESSLSHNRTVLITHAVTQLVPVSDVDDAITVATQLAEAGWTHGDLAPWNLMRGAGGTVHLLDWESAEPSLQPLADVLHFLLRLGSTTHPEAGRTGLEDLLRADERFLRLLVASGLPSDSHDVASAVHECLRMTRQHVMSRREATLRRRVAQIIDASARQVLA
jgi:hypothetical protein